MTGNSKPFSWTDYAENDPQGKAVAEHIFSCLGYSVEYPRREMFRAGDLIVRKNGNLWLVEAERKLPWTDRYVWPPDFTTLDTPWNKRKDSEAEWLVMSNRHGNMAAVVLMADVKSSRTDKKDTNKDGKALTKQEPFFKVRLDKVHFYNLLIDDGFRGLFWYEYTDRQRQPP